MHLAASNGHLEICKWLIKSMDKVDDCDNIKLHPPAKRVFIIVYLVVASAITIYNFVPIIKDKKHLISVKTKVLDGRIFLTGKVDNPEEKLQLTKLSWEIKGVRSVRNDIKIKEEFNFKRSAKDILITSQLRTALIFNKNIKATNYQIDTYKKKIYVYGIALTSEEKDLVISEATEILDVENVVASILLVEDLRIQKE